MGPRIIHADEGYEEAIAVFRRGGVIAFPTETFYGLCVDPFDSSAVKRIFDLKGRAEASPIPLVIGSVEMLPAVASEVTPRARLLIDRFWPGPLTIIFKAAPQLPGALTAGTGTVGVRLSGSPHARRLSVTLSSPITSTSANPSGLKPPVTAAEVAAYFGDSVGLIIDGGTLAGKKGSTIVDATSDLLKVVREGEIPSEEVLA